MADNGKGFKDPSKGLKRGEIETVFDYGSLTDRDKKVVEEIVDHLGKRREVPIDMIIDELKLKFQLVDIPMMKVEDSIWYQMTKDERIGPSIQGFKLTKDKDGNQLKIPHIGFSADLDDLDKLINNIAKKVKEIPEG